VVGYLHDVVEDTAVSVADIETRVGTVVAECVGIVTDDEGVSRRERKERIFAKMAPVGPDHELALIVKVADRLANVRACIEDGQAPLLAMYGKEHVSFEKAVYRSGLCDALWWELWRLIPDCGTGLDDAQKRRS
jgi:hypothetical protein